ncbi:MAG: hypothetical protein H0W62_08885 [Chitinophagales bacterium]|nr:hypothetical protein [Chitinophagales bacterium]
MKSMVVHLVSVVILFNPKTPISQTSYDKEIIAGHIPDFKQCTQAKQYLSINKNNEVS